MSTKSIAIPTFGLSYFAYVDQKYCYSDFWLTYFPMSPKSGNSSYSHFWETWTKVNSNTLGAQAEYDLEDKVTWGGQ